MMKSNTLAPFIAPEKAFDLFNPLNELVLQTIMVMHLLRRATPLGPYRRRLPIRFLDDLLFGRTIQNFREIACNRACMRKGKLLPASFAVRIGNGWSKAVTKGPQPL